MESMDAENGASRFRNIKLIVFDVDGVLTDGRTWQDARGAWRRSFSVRDAMGIRALKKAGVRVAVITAAKSNDIREHMSFVGIDDFFEDCEDKAPALEQLVDRFGVSSSEVGWMTADVQDRSIACDLGCLITVPSAPSELKNASHHVTSSSGGDGAVLEICSLILQTGNHSKAARGGRAAEA